jgi:RhtB (resistance to homoserine/threonine) family protein
MDFAKILTIAFISLLAAVSPGPDFAIVVKNCISGNFRAGFLTALGVASALLIQAAYCLFGIAILIQESPLLFHALKYLGAAYLCFLGVKFLKEKVSPQSTSEISKTPAKKKHTPFISGLLCNLLNPKATLFILSLFSQFIDPGMGFLEKSILGSVIALVTLLWFVLLSYLLTHHLFQRYFARFQLIITKIMGCVLCCLAIYVAFFS